MGFWLSSEEQTSIDQYLFNHYQAWIGIDTLGTKKMKKKTSIDIAILNVADI